MQNVSANGTRQRRVKHVLGVILDADSLGRDVDLAPVTGLLDEWRIHPHTEPDEVARRVTDAGVVLSNKVPLTAASIKGAAQLKFISVMATGTNNIDLAAAKRQGVSVSNAVAYATPSVVQHTLALILALSTSLPAYLADVRRGRWQQSKVFCLLDHPIREVAGKTLGIIGYGELGGGVSRAAAGLGMHIMPAERPGQPVRRGRTPFEEVIATADYISLHCPLTDDTQHLIDGKVLARMKPTAFLVNTARGGLVDSAALLDALAKKQLAGAAVDVLDREPAGADEPLLNAADNLLVTPHNAWGALESRVRLVEQMRENIQGFLEGHPPRLVSG